ncbi:HEAT repeat domain-containing protein [Streptomyces sp. NPDC048623]|uniref:HEAT repeat domain-containing protein n=1 Tax=Streptomyces sp. NPDC048623 TaxID=3155761 RepID=UPI00343E4904
MDRELLIASLSGSWKRTRAARDALVAQGAEAVGPVLALLCDEESPVDRVLCADVLRRIGEPALLPLAEAATVTASPEVAREVAWTLRTLEVDGPEAYAPLLSHPHPKAREQALDAFRCRDEEEEYTRLLIPLLGDPDPEVRRRAVVTFRAIGAAAVPELRRARRGYAPAPAPRVRAGALEALAEIAGPAGLDAEDLAAWHRLTGIRLRDEVPEGMHLCGSWYAVPTDDQDAVLAAFDLADPVPVTLRTGAAAWNRDQHDFDRNRAHQGCSRVFVSPALDGWTLVFGDPSQDAHRITAVWDAADDEDDEGEASEVRAEVVRERCAALSRRFGAAQWYGMSCGDGWTAWCIAEDGEVVRYYDAFEAEEDGEDEGDGARHPAEAGFLLPHEDGFPEDAFDDLDPGSEDFPARCEQIRQELGIPETCYADDIAARLSVDPGSLGPATTVTGHGVLALTACGREHGHPVGALPV